MKFTIFLLISSGVILASGNVSPNSTTVPGTSQATNSSVPPRMTRIYGGSWVSTNHAPWHVAIYDGVSFVCSGALVGSRLVLTTASCVHEFQNNPYYLSVRYGSLNKYPDKHVQVSKVVVHSSFRTSDTAYYNIAILHLQSSYERGTNVGQIDLASSQLSSYTYVTVTGWGKTSANSGLSEQLLEASFRVWSVYSGYIYIDSYSHSICLGDGGAPVVQNGKLVGIAHSMPSCYNPDNRNHLVTNVYALRSWILNNSAAPK